MRMLYFCNSCIGSFALCRVRAQGTTCCMSKFIMNILEKKLLMQFFSYSKFSSFYAIHDLQNTAQQSTVEKKVSDQTSENVIFVC